MKKAFWLIAALVVLVALYALPQRGSAQVTTNETCKVDTNTPADFLSLREYARNDSASVGTVKPGDVLKMTGQRATRLMTPSEIWYEVEGGWVFSNYCKIVK